MAQFVFFVLALLTLACGSAPENEAEVAIPPIKRPIPRRPLDIEQVQSRDFGGPLPSVMLPPTMQQMREEATGKGGRAVSNVRQDSWGNAQQLFPPWTEGQPKVVVDIGSIQEPGKPRRIPYTQAVILAADLAASGGQYFARWIIEVGIGDGRTSFTIDAAAVQQVTLPAESIRIMFQVVRGAGSFFPPTEPIPVAVFVADGTTATVAPTLTQLLDVGIGGASIVGISAPVGATGFRIGGSLPPAAETPLSALTVYSSHQNLIINPAIDTYPGDYLQAIRHEVIPFAGQANLLVVDNSANGTPIQGFIIWSIDL